MVSYNDVTQFASEAYMNALLDHAQEARELAREAVKDVVGEEMAEAIVDRVARQHSQESLFQSGVEEVRSVA